MAYYLTDEELAKLQSDPAFRGFPTKVRDAAILTTLKMFAEDKLLADWQIDSILKETIAKGRMPTTWSYTECSGALMLQLPEVWGYEQAAQRAISNLKLVAEAAKQELDGVTNAEPVDGAAQLGATDETH